MKARYVTIPQGMPVSVCRKDDEARQWKAHTTRRPTRGKVLGGSSGAVVLEAEGWLILTRWDRLRKAWRGENLCPPAAATHHVLPHTPRTCRQLPLLLLT